MNEIEGKFLQLIRLEENTLVSSFDCGDVDLMISY